MDDDASRPAPLLSPITLRGVTSRNRVVISPMCQYSAQDGVANDWHFAHLARFALGGAGLVFVEATAVQREGRITHGDLGLWSDAQIPPLKRGSVMTARRSSWRSSSHARRPFHSATGKIGMRVRAWA